MIENAPGGRDPGYFGPGVIGKEQFEAEKALVARGENVFGPGVTAPSQPEATEPEVPNLSVRELREVLVANPALVDAFLPVELERAGGPRLGALRALWDAEDVRLGGPRQEVLEQIMDFLPSESTEAAEPEASGGEG